MGKMIGLRVDVDFEIGLTKGVPFLLDIFQQEDIHATFYVTLGPDGFKYTRNRVKTPGYIKRILTLNPWNIITKFGLPYLFKQFFGQPGRVGADHPELMQWILRAGHELGAHGYDHFWWAENIWNSESEAIAEQMQMGLEAFQLSAGVSARVWASPNWRCSLSSLQLVDQYSFHYGADCRGYSPFLPMLGDWRGTTPQFPITMPCLHEIKAYLDNSSEDAIIREFLSHINDGFNIWCIHCYYEGILERKLFTRLLFEIKQLGYKLVPIVVLAEDVDLKTLPSCQVIKKALPGGRGEISFQQLEIPVSNDEVINVRH